MYVYNNATNYGEKSQIKNYGCISNLRIRFIAMKSERQRGHQRSLSFGDGWGEVNSLNRPCG